MNPSSKTTKDKSTAKGVSDDSVPSFIRKTYEILDEGTCSDIIRWSDDGTAIIIVNPTEFAQKILPLYFKHNNLTSFIRQLNMYDFHKKRGLNMDNVYCHDLFQRGKKQLLKDIRRKNSTENTTPNIDKVLPVFETTQARQDLAAVVHENVLLKTYNRDAVNRSTLLESKLKEITIENQALWNQIYQLKEKENLLKTIIVSCIQQNGLSLASIPPILQSELDFSTINVKNSQDIKDNSPPFAAQTTTKMFFPTSGPFSQNFPPLQQEVQKDARTNAQTGALDFSLGTSNPPFDLGKLKYQADQILNEPKLPLLSFDPNRPLQGLGSLSAGLDHLKQRNSEVSKTNEGTDQFVKRNQFKEEDESLSKKFKQNLSGLSDVNLKSKPIKNAETSGYAGQFNPSFGTASGGNNFSNIKDEGSIKKTN